MVWMFGYAAVYCVLEPIAVEASAWLNAFDWPVITTRIPSADPTYPLPRYDDAYCTEYEPRYLPTRTSPPSLSSVPGDAVTQATKRQTSPTHNLPMIG